MYISVFFSAVEPQNMGYDVICMHISPHFMYVLLILKMWPEIYYIHWIY